MNPKVWGRPGWRFLHLITNEYPVNPTLEERENYRLFFTQIQYVLPCGKCRRHYQLNLAAMPLTDDVMRTRLTLMVWLINLHNQVNRQTGKKVLTYTEAFEAIRKMAEEERSGPNPWLIGSGITIVLLLVVIFVLILKKK